MDIWSAAIMLFLIMDPLGNLPVFMSVLRNVEPTLRPKIIARELIFSLIIMVFFLFSGQAMLNFLSLEQEAVRIAGAIILFIIALRMIFPQPGGVAGGDGKEVPFLVPLAVPLIAGPSILAALILLANQAPERMFDWSLALFAAWLLSAVILMFSNAFFKLLGRSGLAAVERLMGMILVMIAIQMLLDGIKAYSANML